jgi:uncharacterized protein
MPDGYFGAMALATLVGLSLGALGGGGSIVTTPILVYVAHIPPQRAVGMSLVVVGVTSLFGAILHLRRGNFAARPALLFSLTGMAGSYLGASGTHLFSPRTLMLLFSALMLVVGSLMWKSPVPGETKTHNTRECLTAGFGVGLLTGFLGVGGGFLIVPALVLFADIDAKVAAGTSLAVIAVNCATGLLGQLRFVQIDWRLVSGFLAFAVVGIVCGTQVANRLPAPQLRKAFGVTVVLLAILMGLNNLLFFPHQ